MIGALQENLLVLLCYDKERAPIIRGVVDPALFGGVYRTVALRIYDFIDTFKKPPGDHLPDILSDKLEEKNGREAALYAEVIENIHAARPGINPEYAMARLEAFVEQQSLRSVAVDLARALQKETDEGLETAKRLIAGARQQSLSVFDPGTRLSDKKRALRFLDIGDTAFPTGILELDRRGFGPTRKELMLYIANLKSGKTWWMVQLAKMALLHRVKVLHLSLEMSEERSAQRYFQVLFAMSKRKEILPAVRFDRDELGRIAGFRDVRLKPKLSLDDPNIRGKLEQRIDKWSTRLLDHIIIKQFPSGQLTMPMLLGYMDNLEVTERFIPDLVLLDYPDLMKINIDNPRMSIDEIYKDFRGVMVARNMAGVVVSQSHRAAAKAKQVGVDNVTEAYSKGAHADTTITYTQTAQEKKLGLARLFVAAGRNDEDKITIVISQQYGMGMFALDSNLMTGNYNGLLPEMDNE